MCSPCSPRSSTIPALPRGKAVLWAYIHVPPGSDLDPTESITAQVERFAPASATSSSRTHAVPASSREAVNPTEIGGDISGGVFDMRQALRRPTLSPAPWRTPMHGVYLAISRDNLRVRP